MGSFRWPPRPIDAGDKARVPEADSSDAVLVEAGPGLETAPSGTGSRDVADAPGWGGFVGFGSSLELALMGGGGGMSLDGWEPAGIDRCCRRCAGPAGAGERDGGGCSACRGVRLVWDAAVSLGAYDGELRRAVMACKYWRDRRVGAALGRLLGARVAELVEAEGIERGGVLVTPVPTTTRRRLENGGIDHAMLLADGVAGALGVPARRVLARKHGPRLAGRSSVRARAEAMKGLVRARAAGGLGVPSAVVLVDDVRTTGATATACIRELQDLFGGRGARRGRNKRGARGGEGTRYWLATAAVTAAGRRASAGGAVPEEGV